MKVELQKQIQASLLFLVQKPSLLALAEWRGVLFCEMLEHTPSVSYQKLRFTKYVGLR